METLRQVQEVAIFNFWKLMLHQNIERCFLPCNRISVYSLLNTIFHIEIKMSGQTISLMWEVIGEKKENYFLLKK